MDMFSVGPVGRYIPVAGVQRIAPILPGLGAPISEIKPLDSVDIGSLGRFSGLTDSATELLQKQSTAVLENAANPIQTPVITPETIAPEQVKTSNVPTYLPILEDLQRDLSLYLPYGEGSSLASQVGAWGDDRDGALRELENGYKERNFAMEALGQRLAEVAREKQQLESQLQAKQQEEEQKKAEAEQAKDQADDIQSQSTSDIDYKINNLEYEIRDKQTAVSQKEDQISNLKWEQTNNPEKKDELQKQIDDLESQAAAEKNELRQKEDEKARLETEKREREAKEAEDQRVKDDLEQKHQDLQAEIVALQQEENQIRSLIDEKGGATAGLQEEISEKKQAADQLQWLISGFEFNTRGMG